MNSFSCPHLRNINDFCERIKKECVPGRSGCVLKNKVTFVIPAEKRLEIVRENKKRIDKTKNK